MLHDIPKNPAGHSPGKAFTDKGDPWGMKLGLITRVDEVNMKADVKVVTGGGGDRFEIDLTQGMYGPRSFWGGVPEVNSVVILGYRRKHKQLYEAMILGYIPTGSKLGYRFDPFAQVDPSQIDPDDAENLQALVGSPYRVKRLKLRPGDVGGMSAAGAEFTLTKDVRLYNRAGDFFELRDTDRTLVASSIHRVENESGVTRISGPIRRGAFYTYPDILIPTPSTTINSPTIAGVHAAPTPQPPPIQTLIQTTLTPGAFAPGATAVGSTMATAPANAAAAAATAAQVAAGQAANAAAASGSTLAVPTITTTSVANQPPYYGAYVYMQAGPGFPGGLNKFADSKGNLLSVFNNFSEFPSLTYSNGRQVYITNTYPGVSMEDPTQGGGAEAFTEYRIEVDHTSI